jgi:hypothetical protein
LAEKLKPELPALELTMNASALQPSSNNQVTFGQYMIFADQTGHHPPTFWQEKYRDNISQLNLPVVGVDNIDDAPAFASWLGWNIPTENLLVILAQKGTHFAVVDYEWTRTMHEGESRIFSLIFSSGHPHDPADRKTGWIGFRVAA